MMIKHSRGSIYIIVCDVRIVARKLRLRLAGAETYRHISVKNFVLRLRRLWRNRDTNPTSPEEGLTCLEGLWGGSGERSNVDAARPNESP